MPPTHDGSRDGMGALTGGAWHPDSPRIGLPGILACMEVER